MRQPKAKAIFRPLFLLLMLLAMTPAAVAQQTITVSGCVTGTDGEPIIGANVIAADTGTGTATDIDGNYTIQANPLATLRFSYIGYETKNIDRKSVV